MMIRGIFASKIEFPDLKFTGEEALAVIPSKSNAHTQDPTTKF